MHTTQTFAKCVGAHRCRSTALSTFVALTTVVGGASTGCGGGDASPAISGAGNGGHSGAPSGSGGAGQAGEAQTAGKDGATEGIGGTAAADGGDGGAESAGAQAEAGGASSADGAADNAAGDPAGSVVWAIDNLQSIGGHTTSVLGAPTVIDTPDGKALQFDGIDDALFVDNHPLAGRSQFTVEIIFRPDAGGAPAQRFFHMQENGSGNRVLFETRLPTDGTWVLDVFVESKGGTTALFEPKLPHPIGPWYNVAAVIDGTHARNYVNGTEQMAVNLAFEPHMPGQTSIGVRINKMYFYKGAIRLARFTPRVLGPEEFLKLN